MGLERALALLYNVCHMLCCWYISTVGPLSVEPAKSSAPCSKSSNEGASRDISSALTSSVRLQSHHLFTWTEREEETDAETDRERERRREREGERRQALHTLNYAVELITWQSVPIALIGL